MQNDSRNLKRIWNKTNWNGTEWSEVKNKHDTMNAKWNAMNPEWIELKCNTMLQIQKVTRQMRSEMQWIQYKTYQFETQHNAGNPKKKRNESKVKCIELQHNTTNPKCNAMQPSECKTKRTKNENKNPKGNQRIQNEMKPQRRAAKMSEGRCRYTYNFVWFYVILCNFFVSCNLTLYLLLPIATCFPL